MDNERLVQVYLGELLDRAVRFRLHLDAIDVHFYQATPSLADGAIPEGKPEFLDSFRNSIFKVIEVVHKLLCVNNQNLSDSERNKILKTVKTAFLCLNALHEDGLVHLPRPSEPIELRRFCRIISDHVLRRDTGPLAVYITEATVDSAFSGEPIGQLKQKRIGSLLEIANSDFGTRSIDPLASHGAETIHVTISRIDARNPGRWPTLIHEAAHKLLNYELSGNISLGDNFQSWVPAEITKIVSRLKIRIDSWLTEIWCDLFAALVMGPSFIFSQFATFVANPINEATVNSQYPPYGFRLRVIKWLLLHRYGDLTKAGPISAQIEECIQVIEYWDASEGMDISSNSDLRSIFIAATKFFQEHFFDGVGTDIENVHKKLGQMIQYVKQIDLEELKSMQETLALGLPIAGKIIKNAGHSLFEEPTSVQEILLAGWLDRLQRLRDSSLKVLGG